MKLCYWSLWKYSSIFTGASVEQHRREGFRVLFYKQKDGSGHGGLNWQNLAAGGAATISNFSARLSNLSKKLVKRVTCRCVRGSGLLECLCVASWRSNHLCNSIHFHFLKHRLRDKIGWAATLKYHDIFLILIGFFWERISKNNQSNVTKSHTFVQGPWLS